MSIHLISDVHGKMLEYERIVEDCEYSIQLGDFSTKYSDYHDLWLIAESEKHKFFAGNHENFDVLEENPPPHYLGRYGSEKLNNVKFFFVGGGFSPDLPHRVAYHIKIKLCTVC